jgi:glycosyltransferase involved in cell wall biosynthesis
MRVAVSEELLFSVVVCTYNRARLMAQAVSSLGVQTLPADRFEILIVDNASTDNTALESRVLARRLPNVRCLTEPDLGLSHARNCGWRAARARYVGFLDDDAIAPERWLEIAAEIAATQAPAAFGGPYYPYYESAKPTWFRDSYESREPGHDAGALDPEQDLNGGNMFVRRDLLVQMGGYDPRLGMVGDALGYGEETELQDRIRRADPRALIYYDPRLSILHLARAEKLSLLWRARRIYANGRTRARRQPDRTASRPALFAKMGQSLAKLVGQLTIRTAQRDRSRYPAWQNYAYEVGLGHLRSIGEAMEQLTSPGGQSRSSISR